MLNIKSGHIALILLIIALLSGASNYFLFRQWKQEKDAHRVTKVNFHNALQSNAAITKEYTVSRREFKARFELLADSLKQSGNEIKRLISLHRLEYVYRLDTVLVPDIDTVYQPLYTPMRRTWTLAKKCIQIQAALLDNSDSLNVSLSGAIPINISIARKAPEHWFWRFKWNKSKWPIETEVSTPCELEIKENVKYNLK